LIWAKLQMNSCQVGRECLVSGEDLIVSNAGQA